MNRYDRVSHVGLVAVQTMTKNRIHALLHRHGILHSFSDLFGVQGRAWLKTLAGAGQALRETARLTLAGRLRLLEQVRQQIAGATRLVRRHWALGTRHSSLGTPRSALPTTQLPWPRRLRA